MDLIYDPFNEQEALTKDGRMAAKVFLLPARTSAAAPTKKELDGAVFVGHTDVPQSWREADA